jgi:hypothetical protein
MSSLFCIVLARGGEGIKIYLLYALMSVYSVGYAFTVIYLLLDARNLLKVQVALIYFWGFQTYCLIAR